MRETIESTFVVRRSLGSCLQSIRKLDPLPDERRRTVKLRAALVGMYGATCAYCGLSTRVEAAHLRALEVGGVTECENLILLCRNCHRLFDSGCASICAMSEVAKDWRQHRAPPHRVPLDEVKPPTPTFSEAPKELQDVLRSIAGLQTQTRYVKAIGRVDQVLENSQINDAGRSYLLIKRAELTRRRSAHGVLDEAWRGLEAIEPRRLPQLCLPYLYYEQAYIRRLQGKHAEAIGLTRRSAETSQEADRSGEPTLGFIAASVNEVLCQMAMQDSLSAADARTFEGRLDELQKAAERHGQYWGGRWTLNCAAHKLQVRLKEGDRDKSQKALSELRGLYYRSDLRTGWDSAARQTISSLEGLSQVLFPGSDADLDAGIGLLARSLLTRLGPRQRPEGIRDVGFGLVEGLRRKGTTGMGGTCSNLERVMNQTMDGTSVLRPWRAVSGRGTMAPRIHYNF